VSAELGESTGRLRRPIRMPTDQALRGESLGVEVPLDYGAAEDEQIVDLFGPYARAVSRLT